jgi:CheY-like chemotaxis protein
MPATKILLVDDDVTLSRIMRSMLEHEGFDITVADDVAAALRAFCAAKFWPSQQHLSFSVAVGVPGLPDPRFLWASRTSGCAQRPSHEAAVAFRVATI